MSSDDTRTVAAAATIGNLLRCWVRETGLARPDDDLLVIELASSGVRLEAEVRHWSAAGTHRFDKVRIAGQPADLATVAALLVREAAHLQSSPADAAADLVARVLDSAERTETHLAFARVQQSEERTPFLEAEQALQLGHPLHPAPKSRKELSEAEARAYAPELHGSFPLHWFAADPSVISSDAGPFSGAALTGHSAVRIVEALATDVPVPDGMLPVPAHPWQAKDVLHRESVRSLVDRNLLRDLGPAGPPWFPTSSLRTVYRGDAAVMLKLSLGLRITNSRRENLRKELVRGVEVARLLDTCLAEELSSTYPGFGIIRDPAWLAVGEDTGLDLVLRENPFASSSGVAHVACVAGLVESGLELAGGDPEDWLRRYINAVIAPLMWLYGTYGIGLEAHQQNTLVTLDEKGRPVGGWYRDNQGYYFAASRADLLDSILTGVGRRSDTVVEDDVIDERLGYYIGVNNLLGLIGAMGAGGIANENDLLRVARDELRHLHKSLAQPPRILELLLDHPTLRCKANLFTRLHGMDELVGPVAAQSRYVTIPNPLVVS